MESIRAIPGANVFKPFIIAATLANAAPVGADFDEHAQTINGVPFHALGKERLIDMTAEDREHELGRLGEGIFTSFAEKTSGTGASYALINQAFFMGED
ncbi:MAG: hypothetical protein M1837_003038 [Sclerophora amabilis]|nr:MAG: hypothetical protein M1837_003038 [Sclerophora amabilis]